MGPHQEVSSRSGSGLQAVHCALKPNLYFHKEDACIFIRHIYLSMMCRIVWSRSKVKLRNWLKDNNKW